MRPVDKGAAPDIYTNYDAARHVLANRIGYYCSYCEMKVYNSIEVEHILPQNKGGDELDWDNFLLSCKYCNTIKNNHNDNITNYFWPDRDNTDLAFDYDEINIILPNPILNPNLTKVANNTIALMGLDRFPGGANLPTKADTRWRSREEVWTIAKKEYNNWVEAPIIQMARSIALCSISSGHYSIWDKVFENEQIVLDEIEREYRVKYLFKEVNALRQRTIRLNGLI